MQEAEIATGWFKQPFYTTPRVGRGTREVVRVGLAQPDPRPHPRVNNLEVGQVVEDSFWDAVDYCPLKTGARRCRRLSGRRSRIRALNRQSVRGLLRLRPMVEISMRLQAWHGADRDERGRLLVSLRRAQSTTCYANRLGKGQR